MSGAGDRIGTRRWEIYTAQEVMVEGLGFRVQGWSFVALWFVV